MAMNSRLIERARGLQRTGCFADARAVLDRVLASDPENVGAWQLRLEVSDTPDERERALHALVRLHPDNVEWLEQLVELKTPDVPLQQTSHRYRRLYFVTAALVVAAAAVALFFVSHNPLQREVDRLAMYNQALTQDLQMLDQQLEQVSKDYRALRTNHSRMQSDYRALHTAHQTLQDDYRTLQATHQTLQVDYAGLQANYTNLQASYGKLQADYSIAVPPPYILIQGRHITLTFTLSTGQLDTWNADFSLLEQDLQRGARWRDIRNDLIPITTVVNMAEETVSIMDFRPFVDSTEFRTVMTNLYNQTGQNENALLIETWRMLKQLTRYVTDGYSETPRFPSETLIAGGGDCEDTAILYASMLKAAPVNWNVYLFYMDSENRSAPLKVDHVAVLVETSTGTHLIETTSLENMEPYPPSTRGWKFKVD